MKTTDNWLAAVHATLGAHAAAGWFLELDADSLDIRITQGNELVLVDRSPIVDRDGAAYLRSPVLGLGGTRLSLVGEVEAMGGSVLHGTYSGLLGGTAVVMDQYVQMRNCTPVAIVRVIARVNGSSPSGPPDHEALVAELLSKSEGPSPDGPCAAMGRW